MSALNRQFLRFAVVGVIGFVVDAGLLLLMISAGSGPYLARVVSFPVAVTVTWIVNKRWTFADARPMESQRLQYGLYISTQIAGALGNYVVYVICLQAVPATPLNVLLALAIGAVAGFVINFAGSRLLVFRARGAEH